MSYLATFIVPTMGRDTLRRALDSIIAQTDPDWDAHIIGDGLGENWTPPWIHQRMLWSNTPSKLGAGNRGGMLRNHALSTAVGQWFAFLDDDDRMDIHYLEWLRVESKDKDLVVFHMKYPDGTVLPPGDHLSLGSVGISFAVRSEFQRQHNIWFVPSEIEDWIFIETALKMGARVKVSPHIAYYVRH